MRTISVTVSLSLVGCKKTKTFEVEDDATDDDIEEIAKEVMFNMIDWGWTEGA